MFQSVIIASVILAAAFAVDFMDYENNFIDYNIPVPVQRDFIRPYSYQETRDNLLVEPYYNNVFKTPVVPAPPAPAPGTVDVAVYKPGLLSTFTSYAASLMKSAITFMVTNALALITGCLATFGICNFTPLCTKLNGISSFEEVQREFRSIATPERFARAAQFVQKAIQKYNDMQKEE